MEEERIGLFIDFENLAIGSRDEGLEFQFKPIADALAERGRVVVRRAYADWSYFEEARRMLVRNHIELIEIPQRMGSVRKNAADIKMAVDAIELAFERDYVTTFVICSGDSDFTPLVHKLRELNKRVIGVGLKASTSQLLPPACDEFLFYENLEGVEPSAKKRRGKPKGKAAETETVQDDIPEVELSEFDDLAKNVTQTLAGLQRSTGGEVRSSSVKRALLRKDSTFNESEYGFRAFGELMRNLESQGVIVLREEGAKGDPVVDFPETGGEAEAFALLRQVVADGANGNAPFVLSGLKNQLRKRQSDFSEKRYGYRGFLQFAKAAKARGLIELEWDDTADDYVLSVPGS